MSTESTTVVNLPGGQVLAARRNDLVIARGVKYADAERFQTPRPFTNWDGIIDCTLPATICPQIPSRLEPLNGPIAAGRVMDEACLHVTVSTPALDGNLPVMVFIHGGAYMTGGGDLDSYSSAGLAKAGGVVTVNVTYRLGIFGYQSIEGVAPPNLGLMDQIAALEWVQRNISCFGGDPGRVCVFGASAGGDSIYCLLGADGAKDLFHRAIIQSAPLGLRYADRNAIITALSTSAKSLLPENHQSLPPERLLEVQDKLLEVAAQYPIGPIMPFAPLLGHSPLPEKTEFEALVDAALSRIPVMIGYAKDEGNAFAKTTSTPQLPASELSAAQYASKFGFQDPADLLFQRASKVGRASFYRFDLAPEQSRFGAAHSIDMPFLLGTWDCWKAGLMMEGPDAQQLVEEFGPRLKRLWTDFAKGRDLEAPAIIDRQFVY